MSSLTAGWYKDPADPSTQRWWDGDGWIGKAIPADQTPPDGPPADEPEPPAAEPPVVPPPADAAPAPQAWQPPAPGWQQPPPPGWQQPPPPGWQQPPPPGWQQLPPPGGQRPPVQDWGPPPGWVPTQQGWAPPPGWVPPPGWPAGWPMVMPAARPHGFALAGLGRRLVARLIDVSAVLILNVIVNGWFAYQWWLEVEPVLREAWTNPLGTTPQPSDRSQYLILTMLIVATALWFAYEVPAMANSGQTLGKRLLQVKVFRLENTDQLGFGRAFRRWGRLGLWTPFWGCWGLGLLFQAIDSLSPVFDPRLRQALHDKTAQTVVVAVPAGYRTPVQATEPPGGEK